MHIPQEDRSYRTKQEMIEDITVLLGGRAAEKIVLDDISTGASSDIERASEIARKMVTRYGMSDKLGPISFGNTQDEVFIGRDWTHTRNYGEGVASEIDAEIRSFIDDCYESCIELLEQNREKLDKVANALLEFEKLDGETFEKVYSGDTSVPKLEENEDEQQPKE